MWTRCTPILLVLLLHFGLAVVFSAITPLGEAPDEPAHVSYVRFIAKNGGPPTSLAQRQEAGYRSTWPPLYHFLAAIPFAAVGDVPPTRLKAVGDSPRRLIPTNGQTIAAFIHTDDEAWPWRGLPLAWHLARLLSVVFSTLAVLTTYGIAFTLTHRRRLATTAAAIHAFLPQFLFIGSVVSDDSLLILLAGLVLLLVVDMAQKETWPGIGRWLLLGGLLGLATVTKYNALPLWGVVLLWSIWLVGRRDAGMPGRRAAEPQSRRTAEPQGRKVAKSLGRTFAALFTGAAFTAGWWFGFVWLNFNQVGALGLVRGSLAALTAGTADASLRQLAGGSTTVVLPPPGQWLAWGLTLFQTFWASFGGGSSINFPTWVYNLLAVLGGPAVFGLLHARRERPRAANLFLLTPLFFLPLPLLRFALSGSLVETAQGRHLFPAISAIALGLAWGLSHLAAPSRRPALLAHPLIFLAGLPLLLLGLSLAGLYQITTHFPPLIPLRTSANAYPTGHSPDVDMAAGVRLAGYQFGPVESGILPLTLVWQATAIPAEDYLIDITVTNPAGQVVGNWLGQPVGGRYPSRAWDRGDRLRDDIRLPLLPASGNLQVTVQLRNANGQPAGNPVELAATPAGSVSNITAALPGQLRVDGLPAAAPFTYRSTISFRLPGLADPPELVGPAGEPFAPARFTPGGLAHFIVAANWPSGEYQLNSELPITNYQLPITNRPRQFQPPPLQTPVNANFADRITLLGYDLPQRRVEPGHSFPLTLYLQANRTIDENLAIFNHLLDAEAVQRGGRDRIPQNFYTTLLWVPGEIVSDAYQVPVSADAPPGIYWLDVGLYPSDQPSQSLPLVVNGRPIDRNSVSIGPLKVGGPPPDVTVRQAAPQFPLAKTFGEQITLLGYDRAGETAQPGQLTFYWRAEMIPTADYTVFVHILDAPGQRVAQVDGPPAGGIYPTSLWNAGEIIRDVRPLPELPPGNYTVKVGLYRLDSGARLPLPGSPDDAVTLPDIDIR